MSVRGDNNAEDSDHGCLSRKNHACGPLSLRSLVLLPSTPMRLRANLSRDLGLATGTRRACAPNGVDVRSRKSRPEYCDRRFRLPHRKERGPRSARLHYLGRSSARAGLRTTNLMLSPARFDLRVSAERRTTILGRASACSAPPAFDPQETHSFVLGAISHFTLASASY